MGKGPHGAKSKVLSPQGYQTKTHGSTRTYSQQTVRAGEVNLDKNAPAKTLDRSRDSSDFDFATVLARGRSRETHSDYDTGSEQDRIHLANLLPAAEPRSNRSKPLTKSTALYAMYDVTLAYVPPQRV